MRRHRFTAILGLLVALTLVAAACAKKEAPAPSQTGGAAIKAPANIAGAGKIVFCSDVTYPPEEFYDENNKVVGSDADIGTKIAQLMGVDAEFDNTGFDGIIPALLGKKCDAIISGMNDTPERRQQVNFADYLSVGQSLAVPPGNPKNISDLTSLSGLSVAVEVGTTNADFLNKESDKLKSGGKSGIDVITFPKDTDAANALKTGKVDAYFADSPPVIYYTVQDPQAFELAGQPVNPIPVGIALRTEDSELLAAVLTAIDTMYSDGSMCKILSTWNMTDFVLDTKPPC